MIIGSQRTKRTLNRRLIAVDPPETIPNSEVKHCIGENTPQGGRKLFAGFLMSKYIFFVLLLITKKTYLCEKFVIIIDFKLQLLYTYYEKSILIVKIRNRR